MKMVTAALLAAALMPAVTPTAFAASFIARPTEPMACPSSGAGASLWQGFFHGRKELDSGFRRYENTAVSFCFRTQTQCKNWLYNMQSEYTSMVWSAVCKKGVE